MIFFSTEEKFNHTMNTIITCKVGGLGFLPSQNRIFQWKLVFI